MPRPRKNKRVCCLPESNFFGPLGRGNKNDAIIMTVDQYEAIRLIDFENLTQEECAERMAVGRGTVQSIYKSARGIIAESLVNGATIKIEGGEYQLYDDSERRHRCGRCQSNNCQTRQKWRVK